MKTFDIDKFLTENAVTITMKGKDFVVKDISEKARSLMSPEEGVERKGEKEIVKALLDCMDKDLEGYGLAAYSKIIREITQNLLQTSSQESQ